MSPDLATALREETPGAPGELRERIALIASTPPPPRRTPTLRRVLLWGAPAAAVASIGAAVVVGVVTSSTPEPEIAAPTRDNLERKFTDEPRARRATEESARTQAPTQRAVPAPSLERAQDVQADMRILVDDPNDLSAATQRALATTRRLGGYVVTVDYGTPEPTEGTANLRVRIPVSRVQAAIVRFSGLGRILAQQTQISDLQQRLDDLTRQIRQSKDSTRLAALRRERARLNRRAAYAAVDLALTTREPEKSAAMPSRFDRAVDDAAGVLVAELAIGAYVLIVAAPFLVMLAASFAGSRAYRRHADRRLLERA